jgi:hypothetical protein
MAISDEKRLLNEIEPQNFFALAGNYCKKKCFTKTEVFVPLSLESPRFYVAEYTGGTILSEKARFYVLITAILLRKTLFFYTVFFSLQANRGGRCGAASATVTSHGLT